MMSPETTDCDSNEYESEVSLDYDQPTRTCGRHLTNLSKDYYPSSETSDNDEIPTSAKTFINGHRISDSAGDQEQCKVNNLCNSVVSKLALDANKSHPPSCPLQKNNEPVCNSNSHIFNNHGDQLECPVSNSSGKDVSPSGGSEGNPTLLLMKKQISEIENEIKQRATTQSSNDDQCLLITVADEAIVDSPGNEDNSGPQFHNDAIHYHCHNNELIGDVPIITDTTSNERKPKELELGEPYKSKYDNDMQEDCAFDNKDPELEALDPMSKFFSSFYLWLEY